MSRARLPRSLCSLAGAALALSLGLAHAHAETFTKIWAADLTQPLSSPPWNIYGDDAPFGSSSTSCFMKANTSISNGLLHLVVNKQGGCGGRRYAAGGVDTHNHPTVNQTYGRWEIQVRMPDEPGTTFYAGLFPVDGTWPPEIDFAEFIGKDPTKIFITQHYRDATRPHLTEGFQVTGPSATHWTGQVHTFAVEVVPGQLRYYVDGVLRGTQVPHYDHAAVRWKLALGTGTGDCEAWSWVGCPSASNHLPTQARIKSVTIYSYRP